MTGWRPTRQVTATWSPRRSLLATDPAPRLLARVAAVTAADFMVDEQDLDGCLDLVLTAVRR